MFLKRVVQSFVDHNVKYAIVGGYAVALHGAVRGTLDIDMVVRLTEKSFAAAEKALKAIGLQSRIPVNAQEVFRFRMEYIKNRNLIAWSFVNPVQPSEVVDIVITHELVEMETVTKKIDGLTIQLASIKDLIKMKKQAGRPQDLEDVKALENLI
jgi:predicted nucleotidyltransferase